MSDIYENLPRGTFTIQAQERIVFGHPAGAATLAEVERYGAKRVFVVSTHSLSAVEDGPLQQVVRALGAHCVGTFATVRSHSPREDVVAAARAARDVDADLLVAVGGGSVIDATKAVQLCLWLGLDSVDAMEPYCSEASPPVRREIVLPDRPIRTLAIPTTLSAAEFTSLAGITDAHRRAKQGFSHRLFVPRSAILDPAATLHTPEWLLSCTGVRAIDHAVETYCSPRANPATEVHSLQGLRLLYRALSQMKARPHDLRPRLDAQLGMWQAMAAAAAGVPTGASHGIGYVLGGTFGVAHGHTSCVMLPAVLQWNAQVNGERQRALSEAMGEPGQPASALIADLVASLEQPGTLRAVRIERHQLDEIAERALAYAPVRMNPRPVAGTKDILEILELAW